jgi:hypothetical protein
MAKDLKELYRPLSEPGLMEALGANYRALKTELLNNARAAEMESRRRLAAATRQAEAEERAVALQRFTHTRGYDLEEVILDHQLRMEHQYLLIEDCAAKRVQTIHALAAAAAPPALQAGRDPAAGDRRGRGGRRPHRYDNGVAAQWEDGEDDEEWDDAGTEMPVPADTQYQQRQRPTHQDRW